jgi:hypothetical protein
MDIAPQQDTRPLFDPQGSASTLANSRMLPDWLFFWPEMLTCLLTRRNK